MINKRGCFKKTDMIILGIFISLIFIILISQKQVYASTIASGKCGDNANWTLDSNGTLSITGTGSMDWYDHASDVPWSSNWYQIKTVIVGQGINYIGQYAFYDCSNLTSVSLPQSLTMIGKCAFENCNSLKSVVLPSGLVILYDSAFYNCTNLTTINFPASLTYIGRACFYNCEKLHGNIVIPSKVTTIGNCAFYNCKSLTNVTLPSGLAS